MSKKLLTISDLINYYSSYKRSTHYSCEENNKQPIVVQTFGELKFEEDSNPREGLRKATLQACHTDQNLNMSSISKQTMEAMLPSFANRPILGYVHKVNGQLEFKGHEMHEEEKDGETILVHDEVPVGVIPETNNIHLEYDKDKDRYNVMVDGYIYEDYSPAVEILEREGQCFCSVEISIRDLSYNAKEGLLVINDGYFSGVTILGKHDDGSIVKPGMEGSNIKLADFTKNSLFSSITEEQNQKLIDTLEALNTTLSAFNIYSGKKGGNEPVKLDELLEKYSVKVEDLTFDYADMTDEELEAAFEEAFAESKKGNGSSNLEPENKEGAEADTAESEEKSDEEVEAEEPTEEAEAEASAEASVEVSTDGSAEETADEATEESAESDSEESEGEFEAESEEAPEKESEEFELVRKFSISHDDIRCALYNLLDASFDEIGGWAWINAVYDDSFVYECKGQLFRQNYSKDNDVVAFSGDRVQVYAEYLTDEEKGALNLMRSTYAELKEFKDAYDLNESRTEKKEILANECYASVAETAEFVELCKDESLDKFSKEEIEKEANAIVGKYAIQKFSLEEKPKKKVASVMFGAQKHETSSSFLEGLLAIGKASE